MARFHAVCPHAQVLTLFFVRLVCHLTALKPTDRQTSDRNHSLEKILHLAVGCGVQPVVGKWRQEDQRVQGQPQLHSEFKGDLVLKSISPVLQCTDFFLVIICILYITKHANSLYDSYIALGI